VAPTPPPDRPLRVGFLVDGFRQPRWVARVIEEVKSSAAAEIVLVIRNGAPRRPRGVLRRLWDERRHLLYALYTRLDRRLFAVDEDAFVEDDIAPLLTHCPVLTVQPIQTAYADALAEADLEAIGRYDLDVALRFGFRILTGGVLTIARYGVWSYHHGDNRVNRGSPAGFWETMSREPVIGSTLQVLTEQLDAGQVIYRSWAPTLSRFSARRNLNNVYWKSATFVQRKLDALVADGPRTLRCDREDDYQPYDRRLYRRPTNREMARLFLRLLGRGDQLLFHGGDRP